MDKVLSFYKGSTVVKHGFEHTGSFFGTIWNGGQNDGNDIKHEYGHSIQERILGPAFYSRIAIPSVITCLCGTHGINYY